MGEFNEDYLIRLKNNQVPENKTLDYKRELHLGDRGANKEFVADVTAFANQEGGLLIIGVEEDQGIPTNIPGIASSDIDALILQMENILRDSTEPRLQTCKIYYVKLANTNYILILKVAPSWNSPHRNKYDNQFYTRKSKGKDQMDVNELRNAFLLTERLTDKIRQFRLDRVSPGPKTIIPVNLGNNPRIMLHAIPINAFRTGSGFNILESNPRRILRPLEAHVKDARYNFDGYLLSGWVLEGTASYVQVFRNGCIEWGDTGMLDPGEGQKQIYSYGAIEPEIIEMIKTSFSFFKANQVEPPILYFLSLLQVKGFIIPNNPRWFAPVPLDRDEILLPDLLVESLDEDPAKIVKPWFDAMWNSFGIETDPCFNSEGAWDRKMCDGLR